MSNNKMKPQQIRRIVTKRLTGHSQKLI